MPYWKLFYHIITATKNRLPLLSPDVETVIFQLMENKVNGLGGNLFAVNGMEDHVHLVVTIPPKIAVATFIGQVKATAAAVYNKTNPNGDIFAWQNEYSVFSFDEKRIKSVIDYVNQQKVHHANASLILPLERIDS